ncbi:MAG: DUF4412 domain-containing protein [Gemmatimonadota bacterium]|nr:DUF4412 domain-containing protein [Gemmatimonadota bacterium]MDH3366586.1 DUF4412 domain-containing protein [Gemmatimonadota bacterium]MDH3479224.1 DUF4412 domain-containing protein [Gemmatimonadota bacterium]MDH3571109.1 DUF4412 domain-containing protein [Gemmatimonadota bacterium]MDH5548778.1 DUF4412 domain-containing protein [Gemmatimonadota bacterium]
MRMKSSLTLLAAMILAVPSAATAQQFEGVIKHRTISVQKYALEDRGFDMSEAIFDVATERILALREELEADGVMTVEEAEVYIKGNLIRMDMATEEGPVYATMDLDQGIMRMVQPNEQMYMEWTETDMERMKTMMPDRGGASEEGEPRATGQTRTINGMTCVAYDIETDDGTTRVWVSKDNAQLAKAFVGLMESMSAMSMEDETDESMLVAKYGFPVLMLRLGRDKYEIEETLSVDRKSVSDGLFTPPAGYKKMTMADMMRGR